jgi:hypothetical protein
MHKRTTNATTTFEKKKKKKKKKTVKFKIHTELLLSLTFSIIN